MNPRAGPPALTSNRLIRAKYLRTLTLCVSHACSSNTLPYPEANETAASGTVLINYLSSNGLTACPYGSCSTTFDSFSPYPEANLRLQPTAHPRRPPPQAVRTARQRFRTPRKALRTRGQRSPYREATRSVPPGHDLRTPRQGSPYSEAKVWGLTHGKQGASYLLNSSQLLPTAIPQHSTGERSKSTTSSVPTPPTPRFVVVCPFFFYQNGPCL